MLLVLLPLLRLLLAAGRPLALGISASVRMQGVSVQQEYRESGHQFERFFAQRSRLWFVEVLYVKKDRLHHYDRVLR